MRALTLGAQADEAGDPEALRTASGLLDALGAGPAGGETDLAALWAARARTLGVEAPPPRGRTAGPAYREGGLAGGQAIEFRDIFDSGELAIVVVQPRDEGLLRLTIASLQGERHCDMQAVRTAECRWIPIWTEPVTVRLENPTSEPVGYFLVTN